MLGTNDLLEIRRAFVRHERHKREYNSEVFYEIRFNTAAALFRLWDDAPTKQYEARARRLLKAYRIPYNTERTEHQGRYGITGSLPHTIVIDEKLRRSPYLTELFLHEYAHVAHLDPSAPVEEIPQTLEEWVLNSKSEEADENEIAASSSTFLALTLLEIPFSPMYLLESTLKNLSSHGRMGSGNDAFVDSLAARILTFTPTVRLVAERCAAKMQQGRPLLETA